MDDNGDQPADNALDLPTDWGRRVRAARAYMEEKPSVERFAEILNSSGMSSGAIRTWEKGKHFPSPAARETVVRRISKVTALPEAFFTADLEGLFDDVPRSVAAQLSEIQSTLDKLVASNLDGPGTKRAIQEAFDDYATRLGERIGKRPPRSKRNQDHPREAREDAA